MTLIALWLLVIGVADLVRWRTEARWSRQALALGTAVTVAVTLLVAGDVATSLAPLLASPCWPGGG